MNRFQLDDLLRAAAARGTVVYTHPDTILKMGTKDVLFETRELSWSQDVRRYDTFEAFVTEFPATLALGNPRVLKQHRGNGGIGVWKVQAVRGIGDDHDPRDDVGRDTFLLCEINVSCVSPFPSAAPHLLASALARSLTELQ
jgi:hypothetical protein